MPERRARAGAAEPAAAARPAAGTARAGVEAPDALLFDLDGTLWDSTETVAAAWNRVLRRLGDPRPPFAPADIAGIMGRTHAEIHRRLFPDLSAAAWERMALACYREEELAVHRQGGRLYPGVAEGLAALAAHYPLGIVSNCQQGYIEAFLEWSGLGGLFADHECHGNTGAPKAENLRAVARRMGLRAPVFIGDTPADAHAAGEAGLAFCHVAHGFGEAPPGTCSFADFGALAAHFLDAR